MKSMAKLNSLKQNVKEIAAVDNIHRFGFHV